jgi:hypothetical protein
VGPASLSASFSGSFLVSTASVEDGAAPSTFAGVPNFELRSPQSHFRFRLRNNSSLPVGGINSSFLLRPGCFRGPVGSPDLGHGLFSSVPRQYNLLINSTNGLDSERRISCTIGFAKMDFKYARAASILGFFSAGASSGFLDDRGLFLVAFTGKPLPRLASTESPFP